MRLWCDIRNAIGDISGPGSITLTSATIGRMIDGSAPVRFDCPAEVRSRTWLTAGRYVEIWYDDDETVMLLGEGIINHTGLNGTKIACDGNDLLKELGYDITLPGQTINQMTVLAALSSLVTGLGWTVEASGEALTKTIVEAFTEPITLLKAVLNIADHSAIHLRRGPRAGRIVQAGNFGLFNGITLFDSASGAGGDESSGILETFTFDEQSDQLINWILPVGKDGFSLLDSTIPEKQSLTGPDGNPVYYVSDAVSIALYGTRKAYLTYPDMTPLSTSAADKIACSNQIGIKALYDLANMSVIRRTFKGKVRGLGVSLLPGDKVRVLWAGTIYDDDGAIWSEGGLDEALYLIRVDVYAGEGGTWQTIELSNVNALRDDATTEVAFAIERSKKVS